MKWKGLLVSVRDAAEVAEALAGGASIIDVKEPLAGPLGAAAPATIATIAAAVGGTVPWTHACGELADASPLEGVSLALCTRGILDYVAAVCAQLPPGARQPAAVKAGLSATAGRGWEAALRTIAGGLPAGTGLVAVAYADWGPVGAPPPEQVIAAGLRVGCTGVLIDTFGKSGPGLFGHARQEEVRRWVALAHGAGLPVAVAGKLSLQEAGLAAATGADVVALRSAVCFNGETAGDRLGKVDRRLVREAAAAVVIPPPPAPV